ncbi:hypothetical protein NC651_028819 [Populus alba x Populus x berolinensis]|nr:hypothetical protein NC651_028819 [Populus alba x Populus x berolinensis]
MQNRTSLAMRSVCTLILYQGFLSKAVYPRRINNFEAKHHLVPELRSCLIDYLLFFSLLFPNAKKNIQNIEHDDSKGLKYVFYLVFGL